MASASAAHVRASRDRIERQETLDELLDIRPIVIEDVLTGKFLQVCKGQAG
jgi:hypothetical protein